MEIIKETKNYIVVNKAPGEDSEYDVPRLLAEALNKATTDFFCIHRLDKTAGGLLVYGKNKAAARRKQKILFVVFIMKFLSYDLCIGLYHQNALLSTSIRINGI